MAIKYLNTTKTSYVVDNVLYSYNTPVAIITDDKLLVDNKYYSITTSKQITIASRKLGLPKVKQDNLFNI